MKNAHIFIIILILFGSSFGTRHAILIGNTIGGKFQKLKYIKNDISGMQKTLTKFCGFKKENIHIINNGNSQELKTLLKHVKNNISTDKDLLLFYYTGHADQKNLLMGDSFYPLSDLKNNIKNIPAHMQIVLFDACQSGSFARLKGGTLSSPFLYKDNNAIKGQVVLYSSSENEYSQESDLYKNSIFTFHFINALRGCGDISGDKKVTLSEAYHYSYNQTISSTIHSIGGVQHPGYLFNIQGEGDIVLADNTTLSCGIILDNDLWGTLVVFGSGNNLTAELAKKKGKRVFVGLAPGSYTIYNNKNEKAYKTKTSIKDNHIVTIGNEQFKKINSKHVYSKGGSRQPVLIGLSFFGGFTDFDLSHLSEQCNSSFKNYNNLNIHPEFSYPKGNWKGNVGIQLDFINRIQCAFKFGFYHFDNHKTYSGIIHSPIDTPYTATLDTYDSLKVMHFYTGIGYTFKYRTFQYISIRIGLKIVSLKFTLSSTYSDALFNTSTTNRTFDKGVLLLPCIDLLFSYPIHNILSIGADVQYNYQYNPRKLIMTKKNEFYPNYKYNFSGFDFSIFATFYLNKK